MHFKTIIRNFNASNFCVYCCLLVFAVLLSLRVEGVIGWSYAAIFLPLWVWYVLVYAGLVVGIVFWIKKRSLRQDQEHVQYFRAMLLSAFLQFPVFLTEILVVINLETQRHQWRAIFTPLYLLSGLSIPACAWSCYRKRAIEFELLAMLNLLQLVFLGIQLDGVVEWSWAVVFIPSWILLSLFAIGVAVYSCILLLYHKLANNQQELKDSLPGHIITIISSSLLCIFLILFMALLSSQLDDDVSVPYPVVFLPLYLALFCLLATSIGRQPGNPWWFGIHKNFTDFALDICPILQEYANISHVSEGGRTDSAVTSHKYRRNHLFIDQQAKALLRTPPTQFYPFEDIHLPD